jgi:hypothetical protein
VRSSTRTFATTAQDTLRVLRVQPGFRALREGSFSGFLHLLNFSQVSCQHLQALLFVQFVQFVQFVHFVHFAVRVEEETSDLESAEAAKASLPTVPILKLCCCAAVRKPNVQLKGHI